MGALMVTEPLKGNGDAEEFYPIKAPCPQHPDSARVPTKKPPEGGFFLQRYALLKRDAKP